MAIETKVDQSQLYLYELLRNPILAGEFIYNYDKKEEEEAFEFTSYQRLMLADFSSYQVYCTGRAVGKTVSLTSLLIWFLVYNLFPNEYGVFTTPSKVHLAPVWENLVRSFRSNTFLKQFIAANSGINSSDFTIKLLNNSLLICRIAGQTGTGANLIGLHSPWILVDEAGYYPWAAFQEMQPCLNTFTSGYRETMAGVPTGLRESNILHYADQVSSNYSKHRVSAFDNPRLTEADLKYAEEQYGGKEHPDYIHYVLGQHGLPVYALFDRGLMSIDSYPVYKLTMNGQMVGESLTEYTNKLSVFPGIPEKKTQVVLGIDLGYCYSADTEVLTDQGWKKHSDLNRTEKVACFDTKTEQIIWDTPGYLLEQEYKGKLLEVAGKSTNFMVTPEHTVWLNPFIGSKASQYRKGKAKELPYLLNNTFKVRIAAKSKPVTDGPELFQVPYYYNKRKDRQEKSTLVKMRDWLGFLAWFISEGSATNSNQWEVNLTQEVGDYEKNIDAVLDKLPYTVTKQIYTNQWGKLQAKWTITCKDLCIWLRDNCGVHSENKRIPDFVFTCNTEEQEYFLRTLLLGDGSRVNCSRSPQYNSNSEILIDQVQKLAITLGYSSSKGYYKKGNMYRCSIMNRQENQLSRDSVKEIDYEGKIYCLKTHTGFYVTRRQGKIAIQGNTEPTAIVVMFTDSFGRLKFHGRIQLEKVSYTIQERLIDFLDTKFEPVIIGMDKGSAGISTYQHLVADKDYLHKNYEKRLIPVDFSGMVTLGVDADGEEVKSKTKPFATTVLQDYTNNHKIIYSSTDLEMISELERMTYTKNVNGDIAYRTLTVKGGKKGEDHFTSALLCGTLAYYLTTDFMAYKPEKKSLARPRWF